MQPPRQPPRQPPGQPPLPSRSSQRMATDDDQMKYHDRRSDNRTALALALLFVGTAAILTLVAASGIPVADARPVEQLHSPSRSTGQEWTVAQALHFRRQVKEQQTEQQQQQQEKEEEEEEEEEEDGGENMKETKGGSSSKQNTRWWSSPLVMPGGQEGWRSGSSGDLKNPAVLVDEQQQQQEEEEEEEEEEQVLVDNLAVLDDGDRDRDGPTTDAASFGGNARAGGRLLSPSAHSAHPSAHEAEATTTSTATMTGMRMRRTDMGTTVESTNLQASSSHEEEVEQGGEKEREKEKEKEEEGCEMPYGVLPCSSTVIGNLFLMWAYGSILIAAARFISEGSELLLEIVNPGLIGGLVLPTLGALPDALLIMVSGLRGTKEQAQEEVVVGVGVLAGSTIMMLSLAWAGSVIVGRCDLAGPKAEAVDGKLSFGWSPWRTGVTTDDDTRVSAGVMILTVVPFVIIQIPLIVRQSQEGPTAALFGLIFAWAILILYFIYQVTNPILQRKRIEQARIDLVHHEFVRDLSASAKKLGGLLNDDGSANRGAIEKLFDKADTDGNGHLDPNEVRVLLLGLAPDVASSEDGHVEERASNIFQAMDLNSDRRITKSEFVPTLTTFLEMKRRLDRENLMHMHKQEFWVEETEKQRLVYSELVAMAAEEMEEEGESAGGEKTLSKREVYFWAVLYMALGAGLAAVFADPVVSSVSGFSRSSGIPAFFVAFVVTPLASNSSEIVSSFIFAMKRKRRCMSLTLSQVYGAVSMNNTLCLGIFLTVVFARGLTWQFSSESLVILIAVLVMGSMGYSRRTFQLWMAVPVLALYPLTLAIIYFCDTFLGWK